MDVMSFFQNPYAMVCRIAAVIIPAILLVSCDKPLPPSDVTTQALNCQPPYRDFSGGHEVPVHIRPGMGRKSADPRQTVTFCYTAPKESQISFGRCHITQERHIIGGNYTYVCPLGTSCFGQGVFKNARRLAGEVTDQICADFTNTSRYESDVYIEIIRN
jgi:hypothetical protein